MTSFKLFSLAFTISIAFPSLLLFVPNSNSKDSIHDTLISNIPGNPKFLFSSLRNFSNIDIIDFFNSIGLETVVERGGRVFPKSQKAGDVAGSLVSAVKKNNNITLYK